MNFKFHTVLHRLYSGEVEDTVLCGKFIQDTVRLYTRYNQNILAYFLSAHHCATIFFFCTT